MPPRKEKAAAAAAEPKAKVARTTPPTPSLLALGAPQQAPPPLQLGPAAALQVADLELPVVLDAQEFVKVLEGSSNPSHQKIAKELMKPILPHFKDMATKARLERDFGL